MEGRHVEEFNDKEWVTNKGKKLVVKRYPPYQMMGFEFEGGGELPEALRGRYTSFRDVETAAKKYLDSQVPVPSNFKGPDGPAEKIKLKQPREDSGEKRVT